ncbi:MAG: GNAT family N-acetyltransferase [Pseudomonadota bacterium]
MIVRPAARADRDAWLALRITLWPDEDAAELGAKIDAYFAGREPFLARVLLCENEGRIAGMIELSLRSIAEACRTTPVPYVEGWCVAPDVRGHGVGRALMQGAEDWARAGGYAEIASDTNLDNTTSQAIHAKLGFKETDRIVTFRKPL